MSHRRLSTVLLLAIPAVGFVAAVFAFDPTLGLVPAAMQLVSTTFFAMLITTAVAMPFIEACQRD